MKVLDASPSIGRKIKGFLNAGRQLEYADKYKDYDLNDPNTPYMIAFAEVMQSSFNVATKNALKIWAAAEKIGIDLTKDKPLTNVEKIKLIAIGLGWPEWQLETTEQKQEKYEIIKTEKKINKEQARLEELYKGKSEEEIETIENKAKLEKISREDQINILKALKADSIPGKEEGRVKMLQEYDKAVIDSTLEAGFEPSEEEVETKELFSLNKAAQVTELEELGYTKDEIKAMKYEKDRVEAIRKARKKKKEKEEEND